MPTTTGMSSRYHALTACTGPMCARTTTRLGEHREEHIRKRAQFPFALADEHLAIHPFRAWERAVTVGGATDPGAPGEQARGVPRQSRQAPGRMSRAG